METRSRSRFIAKPSFALRIPKPLNTILVDLTIHSLAQLGWTKNSKPWYEDVRRDLLIGLNARTLQCAKPPESPRSLIMQVLSSLAGGIDDFSRTTRSS
jgi:hypothetical protein